MSKPHMKALGIQSVARRDFLGIGFASAISTLLPRSAIAGKNKLEFELSLVESSLARELKEKKIDHLDLAALAKTEFGISAVEYASRFFPKKEPPDEEYVKEINKRAAEHDVRQLLIAIEKDIRICDPVETKRRQEIVAVRQWIDVAKSLGCHSVQINATSDGEASEQQRRAVDALVELCRYAELRKINVLLGNYGGPSADAAWVEGVIKAVASPCCRTLPRIKNLTTNANYQNLAKLVPFAKGMTAVTTEFDDDGNEATTDYVRAMQTIHEAGYRGYVGICYQGHELDERAGIRATKSMLEHVRNGSR